MPKKPFVDLSGKRFTRLSIVRYAGRSQWGNHQWESLCDCGKAHIAEGYHLIAGRTKSCGCYRVARGKFIAEAGVTAVKRRHGFAGSPVYKIWLGMKARCNQTHTTPVKNYAERGISVCDRWANSFENFYQDMGDRPTAAHSLERINNDAGYSPENCRWATLMEQAGNKRSTRFIEWNGERKHLAEWARQVGIGASTIWARLERGWSVHDSLFIQP